ncbi:MAG: hypothetical protein ACLFUJ_15615 [Phycisphaerae bacterium]
MPDFQCVVYDFAFTLCSQKYFHKLGSQAERQIDQLLFGPGTETHWAIPWMEGKLSCQDIYQYLSGRMGMPVDRLAEALDESCRGLRFNPRVHELARQHRAEGTPTALVTVNMDCFSDVVAPHHRLEELFDVVINSADHGTIDKTQLWPMAFEALGKGVGYGGSLLIDDSVRNVEAFRSLGGRAILYVDDDHFENELRRNGLA